MEIVKVIQTNIPAGNQIKGKSTDGFLTVLIGEEVATVTTKIHGVPVMVCACCIWSDNKKLLIEVLEKNVPKDVVIAMICHYSISSDSLMFTNEEPSFLKRNNEKYELLSRLDSLQSFRENEIQKMEEAALAELRDAEQKELLAARELYEAEHVLVSKRKKMDEVQQMKHNALHVVAKIPDAQKKIEDFGNDGVIMY